MAEERPGHLSVIGQLQTASMCIIGGTEGEKLGGVTTKSLLFLSVRRRITDIDKRKSSKHSYVLNTHQHHSQLFIFIKLFHCQYSMRQAFSLSPPFTDGEARHRGMSPVSEVRTRHYRPSSKARSPTPESNIFITVLWPLRFQS